MVAEAKNYKKMEGKFTIVGLDIDTTGRRLIDEVGFENFQNSKWRTKISFSQFNSGCPHCCLHFDR
jgi:hypothetical protein